MSGNNYCYYSCRKTTVDFPRPLVRVSVDVSEMTTRRSPDPACSAVTDDIRLRTWLIAAIQRQSVIDDNIDKHSQNMTNRYNGLAEFRLAAILYNILYHEINCQYSFYCFNPVRSSVVVITVMIPFISRNEEYESFMYIVHVYYAEVPVARLRTYFTNGTSSNEHSR